MFTAFPPDTAAGPERFLGQAVMGQQSARWDLAIAGGQPPLRPLRPPALYRSPLPRTKLEATVPDERIVLGGLGRRPVVEAGPGQLTAAVPSPAARLRLSVTAADDAAVAVTYTDPRGGARTVSHAALADVELILHRPGQRDLSLVSSRGAYEYGSREELPGILAQALPEG